MEGIAQLVVFAGLFGVLWFTMIRPQRKRQQEAAAMVAALTEGDDVVTIGGLHGSVVGVESDTVDLVVDADGRVLRFQRSAIAKVVGDVFEPDEPVAVESDGDDEDDEA